MGVPLIDLFGNVDATVISDLSDFDGPMEHIHNSIHFHTVTRGQLHGWSIGIGIRGTKENC